MFYMCISEPLGGDCRPQIRVARLLCFNEHLTWRNLL